jgi:DNA-binding NtrC family response regulator
MGTEPRKTILIIDDRVDTLRFCQRILRDDFDFVHTPSGKEAATALADGDGIAGIILDRDFSKADPALLIGPREDVRNEGLHILRWLKAEHPGIPVVMVTGFREQKPAMEAADLGADFLAWPDIIEQPDILRARLSRALETAGGRSAEVLAGFRELEIVVESPAFTKTLVALHRAIPGTAPILLLGETGTGKDALAYVIHALSGDSARPYVSVNVASLSPSLIESELFGHKRGAYTSANQTGIGKMRFAHGGTLLLNEIGELAPEVQAKLLTAIEQREVVPVGDVQGYPAEFRLVTATSRDLGGLVRSGTFRRDLYHRIAWHTITIPPLRERREDIPPLIRSFLRRAGQGQENGIVGIANEAIEYMTGLPWYGNIRELKAVMEAAGAVARHFITLADVREVVRRHETLWGDEHVPAARDGATAVVTDAPGARTRDAVAGVVPASAAIPASASADSEREVFAGRTYRELTARYFEFLCRETDGKLAEVARIAGIAKATAYEWKDRFGCK